MNENKISVGAASIVINNDIGTYVQAATHKNRVKSIRDDLEANALWLEAGGTGLLMISCDLGGLELDYVQSILPAVGCACGIPPGNILIGCSHTHSGPAVLGPTCPDKPIDEDYLGRLREWLVDVGKRAVESAAPGRIAWGKGRAQIGYNRRCCWADGRHTMHGDTARADFTGFEGGDNPQHVALFVRDAEDNLKAILYNNTAHTTTFYGADFLSADFPGLARKYFRDLFGDMPVLFFNGTIGDICLENLSAGRAWHESREQKMGRIAHLVVGETLRLLHEAEFREEADIGHRLLRLDVSVRLPSAERLEWARDRMEQYRQTGELDLDMATAHGTVLLHDRFADNPAETIDVHAACINGLAVITVPCEIFCHFGHRIGARSPFPATTVFGIVSGDMGYCPTTEGIMGGHWGGDPTITARWEPTTGYRIVDEAARLLHELHAGG